MRTVLLDNEAVMALADASHRKHRLVVAHLAGVTARRRKGTPARVMVATAVRVEAGWDRSEPGAAAINRYPVADVPLDSGNANVAAGIVNRTGVSVADRPVRREPRRSHCACAYGRYPRWIESRHTSAAQSDTLPQALCSLGA